MRYLRLARVKAAARNDSKLLGSIGEDLRLLGGEERPTATKEMAVGLGCDERVYFRESREIQAVSPTGSRHGATRCRQRRRAGLVWRPSDGFENIVAGALAPVLAKYVDITFRRAMSPDPNGRRHYHSRARTTLSTSEPLDDSRLWAISNQGSATNAKEQND